MPRQRLLHQFVNSCSCYPRACRAIGLYRPPVGTFVPGVVSRDGSVVGGDSGGRRLVGSIVGSTGVKNASPWADLPPKAMSPFAVDTRSPGRNVGSFFTPSGAKPNGSLPLHSLPLVPCDRGTRIRARYSVDRLWRSPLRISLPKKSLVLLYGQIAVHVSCGVP